MPDPRPRSLPLLALAVACAGAFMCAYLLWVRTRFGQRIDQAAFDGRPGRAAAYDAAGDLLATISVGSLALAICVLAGQALLRHRTAQAIVAATIVVGSLLTTELLKKVVLERPALLDTEAIYRNSFPSGHTTIAFGVGVAAMVAAPPRLRRLVALLAFAYGTAVGIAVIAAGWHRPSDVVGGMLVVTCWAASVVLCVSLADRHAFRARWPGRTFARGYLVVAAALVVAGWCAAIAIAAASRLGRVHLTGLNAAFVLACASIAAFAAVLLAALLTALRDALPTE